MATSSLTVTSTTSDRLIQAQENQGFFGKTRKIFGSKVQTDPGIAWIAGLADVHDDDLITYLTDRPASILAERNQRYADHKAAVAAHNEIVKNYYYVGTGYDDARVGAYGAAVSCACSVGVVGWVEGSIAAAAGVTFAPSLLLVGLAALTVAPIAVGLVLSQKVKQVAADTPRIASEKPTGEAFQRVEDEIVAHVCSEWYKGVAYGLRQLPHSVRPSAFSVLVDRLVSIAIKTPDFPADAAAYGILSTDVKALRCPWFEAGIGFQAAQAEAIRTFEDERLRHELDLQKQLRQQKFDLEVKQLELRAKIEGDLAEAAAAPELIRLLGEADKAKKQLTAASHQVVANEVNTLAASIDAFLERCLVGLAWAQQNPEAVPGVVVLKRSQAPNGCQNTWWDSSNAIEGNFVGLCCEILRQAANGTRIENFRYRQPFHGLPVAVTRHAIAILTRAGILPHQTHNSPTVQLHADFEYDELWTAVNCSKEKAALRTTKQGHPIRFDAAGKPICPRVQLAEKIQARLATLSIAQIRAEAAAVPSQIAVPAPITQAISLISDGAAADQAPAWQPETWQTRTHEPEALEVDAIH